MKLEKKYANELGSFVMGLPEAKDLFSEVGNLSIVIIKGKPALRLKDKSGWTTHFWKAIQETTFCDMKTAHHVAKELGFKPSDTTEVSMSLVGKKKKVMVKVFDTNTRPAGFKSDSIENALEMGFELGRNKNKYYLKKNEEYFEEGKVIEGEGKVIKKDFLQFVYSTDPDPVWLDQSWLDQWEVRIKQITLSKVICCCTYMAGYSILLDKD